MGNMLERLKNYFKGKNTMKDHQTTINKIKALLVLVKANKEEYFDSTNKLLETLITEGVLCRENKLAVDIVRTAFEGYIVKCYPESAVINRDTFVKVVDRIHAYWDENGIDPQLDSIRLVKEGFSESELEDLEGEYLHTLTGDKYEFNTDTEFLDLRGYRQEEDDEDDYTYPFISYRQDNLAQKPSISNPFTNNNSYEYTGYDDLIDYDTQSWAHMAPPKVVENPERLVVDSAAKLLAAKQKEVSEQPEARILALTELRKKADEVFKKLEGKQA